MAGTLKRFPIHIYGHLEEFKEDWLTKIVSVYNLTTAFDYSVGRHATAINHPDGRPRKDKHTNYGDPNYFRYFYRRLIHDDPSVGRAICNIILIDYVCLPHYVLPPMCSYLESIRIDGMKLFMQEE